MNETLVIVSLTALVLLLGLFCFRFSQDSSRIRARFGGVVDADAELTRIRSAIEQAKRERQTLHSENESRRKQLEMEYEQGLARYKELKKEVSLLEENLEDISFGLYKPHFTFQSSEEYKSALEKLRDRERQLIRDSKAASCRVEWTVGESRKKGSG